MAVLSAATASGRQFYQGQVPNAAPGTAQYTAPTYASTTNVTSPSATAYIKEINISNTSGSPASYYIAIGGSAATNAYHWNVNVNNGDAKTLSGLNVMLPAGTGVYIWASVASAITATISGVEVV